MRKDILERKEELLAWIKTNKSKSFICQQFACRPSTLETVLTKLDLKYKGNQGHNKGKVANNKKTFKEINSLNSVTSYRLKFKLFEEGLKEKECERCGIKSWQGVDAPLELHHIDGNRFNNILENLQILCPNCHALTDNYSGKKK